jgi:hypothetical protein
MIAWGRSLVELSNSNALLIIAKGKASRSAHIVLYMILISFGVMGYGIYQGLTYNQAYAAVIAGAGMVFIAAMGVRYVLELRAASSEVSVFHDGIELYDRRNRSRRFFPTKIKIPKEDISDIKIAASLEMNRDPSTIRPGIDDMVISTKSGKDLYLMQRPFSQLREAATLMGFSESVTGLATITRQPMDPVSYENTNDDLQYKTVERKLIIGFSLVGILGMLGMVLTKGYFSWSMLLLPGILIGVILFCSATARRSRKDRDVTPTQVSMGWNGSP